MEIVGEEKTPSPTPPQAAADAASAPIRSSSDPFPLGQCEKWQCVPLCSTALRCSLASLCVSGCSVTRALAAIDRDEHAKRPDGHDDCGLCGGRIESRQPDGRWGDGRAHKSCITEQRRAASKPIRSVSAPAATAGAGRKGTRVFSVRTARRPYHSLSLTQKRERRREAREFLQAIDCPVSALGGQVAAAAELLHLSTSARDAIRSVPSLRIPCEESMANCKRAAAVTHGTETAAFDTGAYLTDPLHFVRMVTADSPLLVVGGDCGGGHTKLGVTYTEGGKQTFAALLVYADGDDWQALQRLRTAGLTPFTGASADCADIFAVLQRLLDDPARPALLNGDWLFLNALLGLKAPQSSNHPCPICIVRSGNFLSQVPAHVRYRSSSDRLSCHSDHPALLRVTPERIVPTPLHVFLGISNRIIFNACKRLAGDAAVAESVARVKTTHSAGCGGLSDLYQLNGPEITQWLKRNTSATLLSSFPRPTPQQRANATVLLRWMTGLKDSLLSAPHWDPRAVDTWRAFINDLLSHWVEETGDHAFPKLHMLTHSVDFLERYRFLGRASEAQLESFHATFNRLFHRHHNNQGAHTAERHRRSLADTALAAAQPSLVASERRRAKALRH